MSRVRSLARERQSATGLTEELRIPEGTAASRRRRWADVLRAEPAGLAQVSGAAGLAEQRANRRNRRKGRGSRTIRCLGNRNNNSSMSCPTNGFCSQSEVREIRTFLPRHTDRRVATVLRTRWGTAPDCTTMSCFGQIDPCCCAFGSCARSVPYRDDHE